MSFGHAPKGRRKDKAGDLIKEGAEFHKKGAGFRATAGFS